MQPQTIDLPLWRPLWSCHDRCTPCSHDDRFQVRRRPRSCELRFSRAKLPDTLAGASHGLEAEWLCARVPTPRLPSIPGTAAPIPFCHGQVDDITVPRITRRILTNSATISRPRGVSRTSSAHDAATIRVLNRGSTLPWPVGTGNNQQLNDFRPNRCDAGDGRLRRLNELASLRHQEISPTPVFILGHRHNDRGGHCLHRLRMPTWIEGGSPPTPMTVSPPVALNDDSNRKMAPSDDHQPRPGHAGCGSLSGRLVTDIDTRR